MAHKIFVNLPTKDLKRSRAFWESMGYSFNPQFSDDTAACLVFSEDIYAMLLTHPKFKEFIDKPIVDTDAQAAAIICLSADSKDEVHRLVDAAVKAGGKEHRPMMDYGFMIQRSFADLDGHNWEVVFMDPSHVQPQS